MEQQKTNEELKMEALFQIDEILAQLPIEIERTVIHTLNLRLLSKMNDW